VVLGERPPEIEEFLKRRHALGQDGNDEVWEGEYHMVPMAHPRHGYVDSQLGVLLDPYAQRAGLVGTSAFNLGEPENFRVPDRGFHRTMPSQLYVPTSAIVVEVVSPDDETWDKFPFYAARGVEEICAVEPLERRVRWWRLIGEGYEESDNSDLLGVRAAELERAIDWPD
jgi:Uma2 family endonuclease